MTLVMTQPDRWKFAAHIVAVLNLPYISKRDVFKQLNTLHERKMGKEYWSGVSCQVAREDCSKIFPDPNALTPEEQKKQFQQEFAQVKPKPKRRRKKKETNRDSLRCAFWFIDKCNSLEDAEIVFRAAVAAIKELENKDVSIVSQGE